MASRIRGADFDHAATDDIHGVTRITFLENGVAPLKGLPFDRLCQGIERTGWLVGRQVDWQRPRHPFTVDEFFHRGFGGHQVQEGIARGFEQNRRGDGMHWRRARHI